MNQIQITLMDGKVLAISMINSCTPSNKHGVYYQKIHFLKANEMKINFKHVGIHWFNDIRGLRF
jgi:hypothetical protein